MNALKDSSQKKKKKKIEITVFYRLLDDGQVKDKSILFCAAENGINGC